MKAATVLIAAAALCVALCASGVSARKGVLELDSSNFDKIVDGSRNVLVMFAEYAWKDSAMLESVGEEFASAKDVLITKIATRDNADIAARFGAEGSVATIKWFAKGTTTGIDYSGDLSSTNKEASKDVIAFVHNAQSPQIQELSRLAKRVADAPAADMRSEAEHLIKQLPEQYAEFGKTFLAVWTKVEEKGKDYPVKERHRLNGLIENKSTKPDKKRDFGRRLSVVEHFVTAEADAADKKANPPKPKPPAPVPPPPPPSAKGKGKSKFRNPPSAHGAPAKA